MRADRFAPARKDRSTRIVIALAVAGLALISLLGTWGALLFIVAALALCAMDPLDSGRTLIRFLPLLLIPFLAMISTLWSDAPQLTLRAAIQLLLTMVAAIIVARRAPEGSLIAIMFWSFLALCLVALPELPKSLAGGTPLTGPFESKNALGYAAHFLFALALALLFTRSEGAAVRFTAAAAMAFAVLLVWQSKSAGAQITVALTALLFPVLVAFGRIPFWWRIGASALIVALIAIAFAFLPAIEAAIVEFRGETLGKDATLTGRTLLWEMAARISSERPILGHGYSAFWRHGNVEAEGIWRWAGIGSRSGFNFHNAFVEMRVELGLAGLVLLIGTCAAIGFAVLSRQFTQPSVANAFFAALTIVLYIRSLAETVLIGPFSLTMALWFAGGVYAFSAGATSVRRRDRSPALARKPRDRRAPRPV